MRPDPNMDKADYTFTKNTRLKEELDSWRPYAEALRQEDREVFREMMNAVSAAYSEAIQLAERGYDTESLLMSIVLGQQKSINWLASLARRVRDEQSETGNKNTEESRSSLS